MLLVVTCDVVGKMQCNMMSLWRGIEELSYGRYTAQYIVQIVLQCETL
mgnify:FL=1